MTTHWSKFRPVRDTYWEWWSSAGNLRGCFDTREQLIEAVADYIGLHGWEAAKWFLVPHGRSEIAGEITLPGSRNPIRGRIIEGPELFKLACTYG